MAKKQTRRSISVSRTTYEKLKSFCETNGISMSQFVENRVGDFLSEPGGAENSDVTPRPAPAPRQVQSAPASGRPSYGSVPPSRQVPAITPVGSSASSAGTSSSGAPSASPAAGRPAAPSGSAATPMTSAAARYAVEPPPPIIKRTEVAAPKAPTMPKANEIFTF
jgi:hypothetical protein